MAKWNMILVANECFYMCLVENIKNNFELFGYTNIWFENASVVEQFQIIFDDCGFVFTGVLHFLSKFHDF